MRHSKATGTALASAAALGIALAAAPATAQQLGHAEGIVPRPDLDAEIVAAVAQCAQVAPQCAEDMAGAAGAVVFPSVFTVDLLVGGSGGNGALVQNGEITGYYDIGEASAGLQMGIKEATQVYVLEDEATLRELTDDGQWQVGLAADLTVISANATASAQTGNPRVYIFDADGLNAGINVSALRIWQDNDD